MKTSLPLLLLIFLTSCSHSPKYEAWQPAAKREARPAAVNPAAAEPQPAIDQTNEAAATMTSASVPTNEVVAAMTPASVPTNAAAASLTATNPVVALRTNLPARPPFTTL